MFVVIVSYHPLEDAISTAGTFYMYSILCCFGVIFVIAFVPETKGKSLESIALLFAKKPKETPVYVGSLRGCDNLGNTIQREEEITKV